MMITYLTIHITPRTLCVASAKSHQDNFISVTSQMMRAHRQLNAFRLDSFLEITFFPRNAVSTPQRFESGTSPTSTERT